MYSKPLQLARFQYEQRSLPASSFQDIVISFEPSKIHATPTTEIVWGTDEIHFLLTSRFKSERRSRAAIGETVVEYRTHFKWPAAGT